MVVPDEGSAMADEPQLQKGAQSDWVAYLQQMLGYLGVFDGEAHGTFDDTTHQAVTSLQQRYSIDEDGNVGEQTWKLLALAQASTDPANARAGFEELDSQVDIVEPEPVQQPGEEVS
jgi:peptidoglycan hydrolase-like protein with peptidoglycan-binding domain